jgi:hypothetical protein
MGQTKMKTLFVIAAFASLAHSPAQAWTYIPTTYVGWLIGNHSQIARQLSTEHLLSIAFPEPVVINRASVVIKLDQAIVFIDPVGNQEQYRRFGRPDIVILTRAHPDHLSIDTMIGMLRRDTVVLAPQAVINQLPLMISNNVISPFDAGTAQEVDGITFSALSASSNIPRGAQVYARDRGDIGVVIEVDGASVYF